MNVLFIVLNCKYMCECGFSTDLVGFLLELCNLSHVTIYIFCYGPKVVSRRPVCRWLL